MNNKRIPVATPVLNGNEKKYVIDCLDTTWISSNGKYISEFENKFAKFVGAKNAIAVTNGTVALHLACLGTNIVQDDEVIMPTFSYIATANSVAYCGAKPVFVDSEKDTWNIKVSLIESKITPKTKAIMPVHIYGHPADMSPLIKIAKKHNLHVIEDAAEALGAYYEGKHVGPLGDVGIFSFFGNKNITTGEGGMVVTNNDEIAMRIRLLKGQGMDPNRRYWHPTIGYNYRMTNIAAAIGLAQLEKVEWHLKRRRNVSRLYDKYLSKLTNHVQLPIEKTYAHSCYWMYSIVLKDSVKKERDQVRDQLDNEFNIETRPFFYPMHIMPPYYERERSYPTAEHIASRGINLPTHELLSEEDIKYIANSLESSLI